MESVTALYPSELPTLQHPPEVNIDEATLIDVTVHTVSELLTALQRITTRKVHAMPDLSVARGMTMSRRVVDLKVDGDLRTIRHEARHGAILHLRPTESGEGLVEDLVEQIAHLAHWETRLFVPLRISERFVELDVREFTHQDSMEEITTTTVRQERRVFLEEVRYPGLAPAPSAETTWRRQVLEALEALRVEVAHAR